MWKSLELAISPLLPAFRQSAGFLLLSLFCFSLRVNEGWNGIVPVWFQPANWIGQTIWPDGFK